MLHLAKDGAREGLWLRAGRQSAGRGRLGRNWLGEEGNLYCSTLVRLGQSDGQPTDLSFLAGLAVHDAVKNVVGSADVFLKWPNDLMVVQDGGWAKLSGMLLERAGDAVVIGIGVNVSHAPEVPGRATTCLAALGASATAADLIETIAARFAYWLALWRGQGFPPIRDAWLARAHPPGTPLRASLPDGSATEGHFDTLDASGTLILRLANGERSAIHAGDIFLA